MKNVLGLLILSAGLTIAADKPVVPPVKAQSAPSVRLPKSLTPAPKPAVAPAAVTKLAANSIYVIDADVECYIESFNPKLVSITSDAGPVKIRAEFADSPGKVQTRTFSGKYVYSLVASGTGTANLVVAQKGLDKPEGLILITLEVDDGTKPVPPPNPNPTPTPTPTPDEAKSPFNAAGFRVLIIYPNKPETDLAIGYRQIISGSTCRDFLEENCVVGPNGQTKEFRIWREDANVSNAPQLWRDTFARPRKQVPWVLIGNGKTGYEGPLPTTEDEFIKLASKYLQK